MSNNNKVRVLYDFCGQADGELSVFAGEECKLVSTNVGDGWWQVSRNNGEFGLVPASFVELIEAEMPNFPPPARPISTGNDDYSDDFFESDDEAQSQSQPSSAHSRPSTTYTTPSEGNFKTVTGTPIKQVTQSSENAKLLVIRKGINRESAVLAALGGHGSNIATVLSKTGGEDYLISLPTADANNPQAVICNANGYWYWQENPSPYTCSIMGTKKDKKIKGLKSFTAYVISNSLTQSKVERRFKQFCWLHERLKAKYPCILIPPLPDKTLTNRFDDEVVNSRFKKLQKWLTRMSSQPVVAQSDVFKHFVTCTDGTKWKSGKRDAETDPFQGGKFYFSVNSTDEFGQNDMLTSDTTEKYINLYDRNLKQLNDIMSEHHDKLKTTQAKEFASVSHSFRELAGALSKDPSKPERAQHLINAVQKVGEVYQSMSIAHGATKESTVNFLDTLREYSGLAGQMPALAGLSRASCSVMEEGNRAASEDKLTQTDNLSLRTRAQVLGRSVMAELNHHASERCQEWVPVFKEYLSEQAKFYRQLADSLDSAANQF